MRCQNHARVAIAQRPDFAAVISISTSSGVRYSRVRYSALGSLSATFRFSVLGVASTTRNFSRHFQPPLLRLTELQVEERILWPVHNQFVLINRRSAVRCALYHSPVRSSARARAFKAYTIA